MKTLHKAIALSGVLALAVSLSACSSDDTETETGTGAESSENFPVTFEGALGTTTIESEPTRVATWGWGATDTVLALGIVPVAIPSDDYSGGEDRISPWIEDALTELGAETPIILDASTYELSVEELLAADPDVLLAPYSGLTQEEFDAVTAAGIPVVAYEEAAWSTPWRDEVEIIGKALGKSAEAAEILEGLDALVAEAAAANPEFAGTSIAVLSDYSGTYYIYLPVDPRVEILLDLGFVSPQSVADLDTGESTFSATVSPESLDTIDADVILTFVDSQETFDAFVASETTQLVPAVKKGAVTGMLSVEEVAAVSPTPLTLPWILPTLTERLAAATAVAKG